MTRSDWIDFQSYRPLRSTARIVAVGLWLVVGFELVRALVGAGVVAGGKARAALYLANLLLLLWFTVRAARNARALGSRAPEGPFHLAAFFLVPLTNVFLPYLAVRDVWQGSQPAHAPARDRRPWWLLGWWALQVLHLYLESLGTRPGMVMAALIGVGAALATGRMMARLAAVQERRAAWQQA